LFNQANADAPAGKPGLAILDYSRAQLLAPSDADIAANLHFVRAKAGLPDPPESCLVRSLTYARPNTLAQVGCFGLLLAGISTFLVRLYPQRRLAFRSLTFVGALLIATATSNAIVMWPRAHEAVVIHREAPAITTPVLAAEPLFKLQEGETVSVRRTIGLHARANLGGPFRLGGAHRSRWCRATIRCSLNFGSADCHGIAHRGPYVAIHRGDGWPSQPPQSVPPEWLLLVRHRVGSIAYTKFTPLQDYGQFRRL